MITYQHQVNMTPGRLPVRVKLNQYDDDWTIIFSLYTDSGNFTLESGTTAKIRGTKRDGLGYSANATVDIANKTVTVAGDKQITAVSGENTFEIVLYKGQKELSTANVVFFVEQAAMDAETLISDSQVQEILDMSADVIAASANVSTLRGNFAPAYSSSATYAVGDYAMHNNQLYRCTTAITTAEAWTAGHWTAVSLGGDVSDLKSELNQKASISALQAETNRAEAEEARIEALFTAPTQEAVDAWLDAHPEATTTVQDGSLTNKKLVNGTLGFVTPEMYGAKGDGIADDTDKILHALNSGYPVFCQQTYLITHLITVSDGGDIALYGGTFIFNSNGQENFLYALRCKSLTLENVKVVCTDGGYTYGAVGGTFAMTLYTPIVSVRNCVCERITMLYRSNYVLTNDGTQYFMDSIVVNGLVSKDTLCPIEVGFCRSVCISNITSFSSGEQQELVYITGGILDLVCSGIWCQDSIRFAFHFNNNAAYSTPDNTIRHNWVEHFSLSDSTFLASGAKSVVDPMCPIGVVTVTNVFAGDPIFRSYHAPNHSCQCDEIFVSNSDIFAPYMDGVGGDIKAVNFNNCIVHGNFSLGSGDYPVNLSISDSKLIFTSPPYTGNVVIFGQVSLNHCHLQSTVETSSIQVIFINGDNSSLTLNGCSFDYVGLNRVIYNSKTTQKIVAVNNIVKCLTYGAFIHQTPNTCQIVGNTVNMDTVTDVTNSVAVESVTLNTTTKNISIGESFDLVPTISPNSADNQDCIFNNSASTVASVIKTIVNGKIAFKVTGLTAGTATITVRAKYDTNIKAVCEVTVS